jgi:hypothetical protein
VHSGKYSEYDYYNGLGDSNTAHRSYCGESFNIMNRYSSIENDVWIYVPSTVNGRRQNYQEWFTFVNLFFGQSNLPNQYPVLVLGCSSGTGYRCDRRQLSLGSGPFFANDTILARNNVTWPFDQWFDLRTLVTESNSLTVITLYEVASNATQQLVWNMTSTTVNMYLFQAHWGLYDGPSSGVTAVYNDDITVLDISGQPATSTSTAVPEFMPFSSLILLSLEVTCLLAYNRNRFSRQSHR